jgi:hypothetical protein
MHGECATNSDAVAPVHLCNPVPNFLDNISRDLFWPEFILCIQSCLAGGYVSVCSFDNWRSLEDFPESVKPEEDRNTDVGSKEVYGIVNLRLKALGGSRRTY